MFNLRITITVYYCDKFKFTEKNKLKLWNTNTVSWFLFGTVCQDEEQLEIIRKDMWFICITSS